MSTMTTTMTRNDYFPDVDYLLYFDYYHDVDYFHSFLFFVYFRFFLHVPKTPALPRRSPLSTRVHPKPQPYILMPYFL